MEELIRCTKCIMPNTKPDLSFDEEGVCDACRSMEKKDADIDWEARAKEFGELLEKHKSKDGSNYDCIIPVSGGKDSTYQAYIIKKVYGLDPLCVTWAPAMKTELGKRNLEVLQELGVDHIMFTPNPVVYRKIFKEALVRLGDPCWACHLGMFTYPFRVAVQYKVPLVVYGENPQLEYGGPEAARDTHIMDKRWLHEFGGLMANRIEAMASDEVSLRDLKSVCYPTQEELDEVGVIGIFLGTYFPWNAMSQVETIKKHGFLVKEDGPVEGCYHNYENLDCKLNVVHTYLKYLKFGFGKATDHLCLDIRHGRITREAALEAMEQFDGTKPNKDLKEICKYFDISEEEFWKITESFRGYFWDHDVKDEDHSMFASQRP